MLGRVISRTGWQNYDPNVRSRSTRTTPTCGSPSTPSRHSRAGHTSNSSYLPEDPDAEASGSTRSYNIITTNEIAGGATGPDGTGAELLQMLTGVQSTGLGCGQRVQPAADGGRKVPQCWIVIVPRGTPTDENVGTPFAVERGSGGRRHVAASAHGRGRIASPFRSSSTPSTPPVRCRTGSVEWSGTSSFFPAIASWQPALCATPGSPPYSYAPVCRLLGRFAASSFPGAPAWSRHLEADRCRVELIRVESRRVRAARGIGTRRRLQSSSATRTHSSPEAAQQLAGVRVADMNLTPRLVAKLLTQSYTEQLNIISRPPYEWDDVNPTAPRPGSRLRSGSTRSSSSSSCRTPALFSGLQLPAGNSDAAAQVWEWILADPEARHGSTAQPDEWGMRVNPLYATFRRTTRRGSRSATRPRAVPKGGSVLLPGSVHRGLHAAQLCGTDWMPYARSFDEAAARVRAAADFARIAPNPFALTADSVWGRTDASGSGSARNSCAHRHVIGPSVRAADCAA